MTVEQDAALVAGVFAVDPHGLGGVCLRSAAGPLRDDWVSLLRQSVRASVPVRRVPFNVVDSRLLGGLDFLATLRAGKPVVERGVLASTHGGVVILTMAERLSAHTAAALARVLDRGDIDVAREGVFIADAAQVGIVALDEGLDEETTPRCLLDRFAFLLDFSCATARSRLQAAYAAARIDAARESLPTVEAPDSVIRALCATAAALGAGSLRVAQLAVRVARILAALDARSRVTLADAETAGRLVLAPRASAIPGPPQAAEAAADALPPPSSTNTASQAVEQPRDDSRESADPDDVPSEPEEMEERVLAASQSAIPAGLLARLRQAPGAGRTGIHASNGRFGASHQGGARGRPMGVTNAAPGKSRLNLVATLRAAAPWQALRGRLAGDARLRISSEDLRMTRYQRRAQTLTIFAVDASGSSALNRLAEAKGAVELLLADCYIRRDQVSVIAFRGRSAEVLLPPTRSLVRAKRSLAGLPGGGATPLAAAIDAASVMAGQARRRGDSSIVVMLTDGRGNVSRDGKTGRDVGQADASRAAASFRAARHTSLFVDTSPRPQPLARELAALLDATYVALPYADARALSTLVDTVGRPLRG